jgi:hypothetical protein
MAGHKQLRSAVLGSAVTAMMLVGTAAAAQESDLQGSRAAGALDTMTQRGYTQVDAGQSGDNSYTYWWRSRDSRCVRLTTTDGRIADTRTAPASDCGQRGGSGDAAAGIAVAAAAILGVAALSHRSHHRNDQTYDAQGTADFERGHRDGLYGYAYSNYSRSDAYSRGYESGVQERDYQGSYRRGNSYRGGYAPQQIISDIAYQSADYGRAQLPQRGFTQVTDVRVPGGGHHYIYWNGQTQQCVIMDTRDGRVQNIEEVRRNICR